MSLEGDDWTNNAVEALKLSLVRTAEEVASLTEEELSRVEVFSPLFAYPIFGEEETIFGYRNLEIQLHFASGSLAQYLHIKYDAVYPDKAATDDPEKSLYSFIPPSYCKKIDDFVKIVEEDARTFVPFGERIASYRKVDGKDVSTVRSKGKGKGKGKAKTGVHLPEPSWEFVNGSVANDEVLFEAFASSWETPGFKEFHRRMQVFLLLFIEGATYIEEDDPRWEFLTLFERRKKGNHYSYHFVGFTSFYSFFFWPDTKRLRLSQFFILPPYQGQSHGSALYHLAYQRILSRPDISELTIEDPSEAVEDMRDKADLATLIRGGDLDGLSAPMNPTVLEITRKKYKFAERQFYRLVEMLCLLNLDHNDKAKVTAYRLTVKKRLYLFNRDQLLQIEPEERKEKLQITYEGVEDDYHRLLASFNS